MVLYEATTGDLYPEHDAARDAPWWEPRRRVIGSIEQLALFLGCRVSEVVLRRDGSWTSAGSSVGVAGGQSGHGSDAAEHAEVPVSGTYRIGERSEGERLRSRAE